MGRCLALDSEVARGEIGLQMLPWISDTLKLPYEQLLADTDKLEPS